MTRKPKPEPESPSDLTLKQISTYIQKHVTELPLQNQMNGYIKKYTDAMQTTDETQRNEKLSNLYKLIELDAMATKILPNETRIMMRMEDWFLKETQQRVVKEGKKMKMKKPPLIPKEIQSQRENQTDETLVISMPISDCLKIAAHVLPKEELQNWVRNFNQKIQIARNDTRATKNEKISDIQQKVSDFAKKRNIDLTTEPGPDVTTLPEITKKNLGTKQGIVETMRAVLTKFKSTPSTRTHSTPQIQTPTTPPSTPRTPRTSRSSSIPEH
jgi:hypothetical protein